MDTNIQDRIQTIIDKMFNGVAKQFGEHIGRNMNTFKDIVGGKRTDDPPAGLDQINWPALIALLYVKRYNGGLSIEPHSGVWQDGLGAWGVDYTINYFKPLLYPGDHVAEWAERKRKKEEAERLKALQENK
jgi:hypothetical protein